MESTTVGQCGLDPERRRIAGGRALIAFLAVALSSLPLASCATRGSSVAARREQLFALSYGPGEDQIDLFQIENGVAPLKTRLCMREGIFYIANGPGARVVRFSSFGDVLSMIYDPERNPEPFILEPSAGGTGRARAAYRYPFQSIGELAVDSKQTIYVEDRLPAERRVMDKDSGAFLDYVVLRFDKEGRYLDYLGQEGIGGTPFPYILGIHSTANDECVVISMTQTAWLMHWFDDRGFLVNSVRLRRDSLPHPAKGDKLIASLDRISPDSRGRSLLIKVDYYEEAVDPSTQSGAGIEYAASWVWRMDIQDASLPQRWAIPAAEAGPGGADDRFVNVPEFLGAAGDYLFFLSVEEGGGSYYTAIDRTDMDLTRFKIDIAPDELNYASFFISREGILCALLGTKLEARIVWWRFDKLLKGLTQEAAR
jgi:hypothetical protein